MTRARTPARFPNTGCAVTDDGAPDPDPTEKDNIVTKTQIGAAALAAAATGALALGGTALAGAGGVDDVAVGGKGGTATNNCLNIGIPILSGLGIGGQGSATGAGCTATANGGDATTY